MTINLFIVETLKFLEDALEGRSRYVIYTYICEFVELNEGEERFENVDF